MTRHLWIFIRLFVVLFVTNITTGIEGVAAQDYWQCKLTVDGQIVGAAIAKSEVTIGVEAVADSLDVPPPPPEYTVYMKLWGTGWTGPYSRKIMQYDGSISYNWIIDIDPHGNVPPPTSRCATLSWNTAEFSAFGCYSLWQDTSQVPDGIGDVQRVANMRSTNSFSESCGTATSLYYILEFNSSYSCGDCDGSCRIDITDAVYLINYIFAAGQPPQDRSKGDNDCNNQTDITDAVYLVNYMFADGAPPCASCQ